MATSRTSATSTASESLRVYAQQLMASERRPLERLNSQKTELETKIKIFQSLGSKLSGLLTLSRSLSSIGSLNPLKKLAVTGVDDAVLEVKADSTAAFATHRVEIQKLASRQSLASKDVTGLDAFSLHKTGSASAGSGGERTARFRFEVGEASLEAEVVLTDDLTQDEVLGRIARAINARKGAVSATVLDTGNDAKRLLVQSSTSGAAGRITAVEDLSGDLMRWLGLSGRSESGDLKAAVQGAADAEVLIDGVPVTSSENTIDNVLTGVTITLKSTGVQNLTVSPDLDAVTKKIEEFVAEYNKAMDEVRNQTRAGDEDGQNRGLLAGEGSFTRLRTDLRDAVHQTTGGDVISRLSEIGITANREGRLSISSSADLSAAISTKPEAVIALFNGPDGIAKRLSGLVEGYSRNGGILARSQDQTRARIRSITTRISATNQILARREDALISQLAAMQATIGALASQKQYLSGLLSSMDQTWA